MNTSRLLQILEARFNLGELSRLAFDLDIEFENLAGETRSAKAQALVAHMEQRGRLRDLERALCKLRPDVCAEPKLDDIVPYLGLQTFQPQHANLFFGRDKLVEMLVQRAATAPLLAVLGPSGSGKSSVVLAGLLPALKRGDLPGSERWHYLPPIKPGSRPLDALAAALAHLEGGDLAERQARAEQFRANLSNQRALLQVADLVLADKSDARLVLIVDQFEELWTQAPAEPEARKRFAEEEQPPFINLLLSALKAGAKGQPGPLLIILTMRADFRGRAAEHPDLARAIHSNLARVSPMQPAELRAAIERPAEIAGCRFEPGLVDELIEEGIGQPGALPLLQHTLLELWRAKRPDGTMTREAYRALGGVEGALAASADAILAEHYPHPTERDDLCHLLLRLIQPGEGAADTRRRVLLRDLVPVGQSAEEVQDFLQPLVGARLLTMGGDDATKRETVEISHEALLRSWSTFRQWISESRADLRFHLRLEEAAKEWLESGEKPGLLLPDLRLANAEAWCERARPRLNDLAHSFLEKSRQAEQARRTREDDERREREALLEARAVAERQAREAAEGRAVAESQAREAAEGRVTEERRAQRSLAGLVAVLFVALVAAGASLIQPRLLRQQALGLGEMQPIEGGVVTVEDDTTDPSRRGHFTLPPFKIGRYEVANEQYCLCWRAGGCPEPFYVGQQVCDDSLRDLPVTNVTVLHAEAYCAWLGQRLPTEPEWMLAARGETERVYPTGDDPPQPPGVNVGSQTNGGENQAWPVGQASDDVTLDTGVRDMTGNVMEWTSTLWYLDFADRDYLTATWRDQRADPDGLAEFVVRKGGSWREADPLVARVIQRSNLSPTEPEPDLGFRCLAGVPLDQLAQTMAP